ncbi:MAG: hypothetical protein P1V97_33965, partial [Planctomycetota bacterium]|nr:hypothetical protein [Planctomycetota bacterium]
NNVVIKIGSDDDHKAFLKKSLADLRKFLDQLEPIYKDLSSRIDNKAAVDEAWKAQSKKHIESLTVIQREFYNWERVHVTMPLEKYRLTLGSIHVKIYKTLVAYNNGSSGLEQNMKFTASDIKYLRDVLSPATPLEIPKKKGEK